MIINHKWDVTVIGGGLAGLTASIYLARAGKSVLLLEKATRLGGRAATEEKSECMFNLGAHALYKKGNGRKVLEEIGIQTVGGTADVKGTLIHQGKLYDMPISPVALMTTKVFSWSEKKEYVRLMMNIPKIDTVSLEHVSVMEWAVQHIHQEKVRHFFLTLCRLSSYCDDAEIASAGAVIKQLQLSLGGVTYLDGGWQSMVHQLEEKAVQAGVTILESHKAVEINGSYPDMQVTLANQQIVSTKYVISTASPQTTCTMVKHAEGTNLAALKETILPVKGACLDVALRRLPNPKISFALDLVNPLYYSNHSKSAKLSRNPEHCVIHLVKYLRSGEEQEPMNIKADLEGFLEKVQPGWKDEVERSPARS